MAKTPKVKIRHQTRKATTVSSSFGVIRIDENGFVENLDKLKATPEQILALPNFVDGSTFYDPKEAGEIEEEQVDNTKARTPSDEDYAALIEELHAAEEAQVNSEGYLDMTYLNDNLRERGWPILSGTKRKQLTDEYVKTKSVEGQPRAQEFDEGVKTTTRIGGNASGAQNTPLEKLTPVDEGRATANPNDDNKVGTTDTKEAEKEAKTKK